MAAPPPPPPPGPPSTDPLPHPTSFPSPIPQFPSSDLVISGPVPAALSSSALPAASVHLLHPQHSPQRPSSTSRSSGELRPASSRSEIPNLPTSSPVLPPPNLQGEATFLQDQLTAAAPILTQLQVASQPAQSASIPASSPVLAAVSAAPVSAAVSADSRSAVASVLPLLASVLQPPATSSSSPSSFSLPSPSHTATLHPPRSATSMECSKGSLDTPLLSVSAQNPAPIGSTPDARFNASTKTSSANHHNLSSPPSSVNNPSFTDPILTQPYPHIAEHLPSSMPPPPHPPTSLSYVQAARQSRGPGFVRTHAADVESFARLPRTGANIICGAIEGIPSFSIDNSDLHTVENLFSNALIMKFQGGRPSLEVSHREIQSWGLEHPFSIGPLSSRAFLLRFQDNQDLIKVLTRPSSILITFSYKIFRWHNLCHLKDDSCYAPVWISLPRLPLQCFIPEFLESVANSIGRFLCFDKATTTLARPSAARLCVELDLRITPPPFIWVGLFDGLKQPIIYEKMPKYCGVCHIQGHLVTTCPKGQRETPNIQAFHRSTMNQTRPPPARQNAVKQVSALLQQPNPTDASPPNSQLPPQPNPPSSSLPTPSPLDDADRQQHTPIVATYTSDPSSSLDADGARHHSQHPPPPHQQVQPSVSLLQRDPAAATPNVLLQAQPTAALLQQALLQPQPSATLLQQASSAAGPADDQPPAQPTATLLQRDPAAAAPSAGHVSPLLSASPVQRDSVSAAPSFLPPDPSAISTHSSVRMAPSLSRPPPPHKPVPSTSKSLIGKHKSIKSKPPDVDISSSLSQQQQAALKQFKSKVLEHSRIRDQQLSSSTSVNHFLALRHDHSDADDDVASYYSDTDDGCEEPIEMGYQSANGRSSNKHKAFAPSGMRTNKRHPNMPLHVKLRSRKDSHPSTP